MRYLIAAAVLAWVAPALADDKPPSGIDAKAFATLMKRAKESHTDAIVLYRNGKLLGEWYFDKPADKIEAMSATKSIVGLAIGKLIDAGKIKSLDEPVYDFYPEWKQGTKQKITIRHLLTHTSGLQNEPKTSVEIYPSPDFVKLALAAEIASEPGTKFAYNNKAVNLLAGIVKIASGKRMDEYLRDEIFTPLGITDFTWTLDQAGNPHAMSGLQIRAVDLAKLGQLMLDRGVWHGKRVLGESWIAESVKPQPNAPRYGLLWWLQSDFRAMVADDELIETWRKGGASEDFLSRVMPLKGKVFTDRKAFFAAIEQAFGGKPGLEVWYDNTWRKGLPDGKDLPTKVTGYYADGYLGQYLVVIPEQRLVAVRMMNAPDGDYDANKLDTFHDFPQLVRTLAAR
jgi:CubicO group peptidase (beta-lactamase class C family)